jgi:hypothetical protein
MRGWLLRDVVAVEESAMDPGVIVLRCTVTVTRRRCRAVALASLACARCV